MYLWQETDSELPPQPLKVFLIQAWLKKKNLWIWKLWTSKAVPFIYLFPPKYEEEDHVSLPPTGCITRMSLEPNSAETDV